MSSGDADEVASTKEESLPTMEDNTKAQNPLKKDPPRPQPEEISDASGLTAEEWKVYVDEANKALKEYVDLYNSQMDMLLLFATLFSTVVTAFVIVSYGSLQADTSETSLQVLQDILATLQSNGSVQNNQTATASVPFKPTPSAIRINSCWFVALVLSLCTAFLVILAKQWLLSITADFSVHMEQKGRQHQLRWKGIGDWELSLIMASLPILLHISLILFFVGLIEFLWSTNTTVAIPVICLTAATAVIYTVTHILSVLSPTCPYRSSATDLVVFLFSSLAREVTAEVMTAGVAMLKLALLMSRILGRPSRWRQALRNRSLWQAGMSSLALNTRSMENRHISQYSSLIDSQAIARMVGEFPPSADGTRNALLTHRITHYGCLLAHRSVLTDCGAVALLARQLRSILPADGQLQSSSYEEAVPVHFDIVLGLAEYSQNNIGESLKTTHLCDPGAVLPYENDTVIFANMLRLSMVVSSDEWYNSGLYQSASLFCQRLEDAATTASLDDTALQSFVNTVVYLSFFPVEDSSRPDNQSDVELKHDTMIMHGLTALVRHRPEMGMPVLRQICWGVWFCSQPRWRIGSGYLVPVMKTANHLVRPIVALLSSLHSNSSIPITVLTITEALLCPASKGTTEDVNDRSHLRTALVGAFPTFLETLEGEIQTKARNGSDLIQLASHAIRAYGRIVSASAVKNEASPHIDSDSGLYQKTTRVFTLIDYILEHFGEILPDNQSKTARDTFVVVYVIGQLQMAPQPGSDSASWIRVTASDRGQDDKAAPMQADEADQHETNEAHGLVEGGARNSLETDLPRRGSNAASPRDDDHKVQQDVASAPEQQASSPHKDDGAAEPEGTSEPRECSAIDLETISPENIADAFADSLRKSSTESSLPEDINSYLKTLVRMIAALPTMADSDHEFSGVLLECLRSPSRGLKKDLEQMLQPESQQSEYNAPIREALEVISNSGTLLESPKKS
ncbi:predicted protein [Postia placenta Mad-698-R]|nr:predicted protein [Postia placenta Mad-698-R]